MQFAMLDDKRIKPGRHLYKRFLKCKKLQCELCDSEVVAMCGNKKIWHFRHKDSDECDSFYEPITDFHLWWQGLLPEEQREVRIGKHRADGVLKESSVILTPYEPLYSGLVWNKYQKHRISLTVSIRDNSANGMVMEVQHSVLDAEQIANREEFYKNMFWIIDASNFDFTRYGYLFYATHPDTRGNNGWFRSNKTYFPSWIWGIRKPCYLDTGHSERLIEIVFEDDGGCWIRFISKEYLIAFIQGRKRNRIYKLWGDSAKPIISKYFIKGIFEKTYPVKLFSPVVVPSRNIKGVVVKMNLYNELEDEDNITKILAWPMDEVKRKDIKHYELPHELLIHQKAFCTKQSTIFLGNRQRKQTCKIPERRF